MSFDSIRRILSHTPQQPMRKEMRIAQVFDAFQSVLVAMWGEERARLVEVVSFTEAALKITTATPAAKQQLQLDLPRIKNEVNRRLGALIVKQISVIAKGF